MKSITEFRGYFYLRGFSEDELPYWVTSEDTQSPYFHLNCTTRKKFAKDLLPDIKRGKILIASDVYNKIASYKALPAQTNLTDSKKVIEPQGISLLQHQLTAVNLMLTHNRFGFFMQPGTGKTFIAVSFLLSRKPKTTLIVTPKKVISQFQACLDEYAPDLSYDVINYESLHKVKDNLYECIILDESHYVKNYSSIANETLREMQATAKYVYLFTEEESKVIAYKNNIIAKAVLDILTSGKTSAQIRDQVVAVLSAFRTNDINLDSEIVQPGYTRTLRQCLNLDQTGKMNTMQLVIEFMENFVNDDLKLNREMKPKRYNLKDLYSAFEFALISEGILKSDRVYDINNVLKVRLDSIINGDYGRYFEMEEYIDKKEYVKRLFTNKNGEKVQIINLNLNYVDERFAKALTKIYSKLFLDYAIALNDNGNYSIQILLEEAHRYVQADSDTAVLGYNIFDRITKEGRKYGVILGFITQRPSELSTTSLSQCSNYIVLRMFHPDDLKIVKAISHSISDNDIEKLKSLSPGCALCFGNAFNIPTFAKIDKPDPTPTSSNAQIGNNWFVSADKVNAPLKITEV